MNSCDSIKPVALVPHGNGVWSAPGARIIDRSGRKMLPVGRDGFVSALEQSVLVDKTMLIADILDSGYTATLFCRPRRFGKTLNMTMLKAFFEIPTEPERESAEDALFEDTEIWDAADGAYRKYRGSHPVIYVSFRTAKASEWSITYGAIKNIIATEFDRYSCLAQSAKLSDRDKLLYSRIVSGSATDNDWADSLLALCRMLKAHYGKDVVVLVDEYDAPVMAGYSASDGGYYQQVVDFLKRWLTGALKDGGEALAFACLTGVQRISKESIFSDLNNLTVSTSLSSISDDRFGFTEAEVAALAAYLEHDDCVQQAREWYDGYRFGSEDIYNPWSILNYFDRGCVPGVYWANTSSNEVVGSLVRNADPDTLAQVYSLLEPQGYVASSLDLGVVFPDVGIRAGALWSMLYLAGYLTTDLTEEPDNNMALRPLRIPNREIAQLFRNEVIGRFAVAAGGEPRLAAFHRALCSGDGEAVQRELDAMVLGAGSSFDFISENSCHLFLLGLCFGIPGYADPLSNRESGYGRYDIRLEPVDVAPGSLAAFNALEYRPLVIIEIEFSKGPGSLETLANEALRQIEDRRYDCDAPAGAAGRLRWGIAFSGKRVAVAMERLP